MKKKVVLGNYLLSQRIPVSEGNTLMDNAVRIQWKKSSASLGGSQCVEVADLGNGFVGVRDSKDPSGPVFEFTPRQWQVFVSGLRGAKTP